MDISLHDMRRISKMARLELSDDELTWMTPQLGEIVDFVDKLMSLDTTGVEPMAHAIEVVNRWGADELGTSLARDAALANAPSQDEEFFLVPAVLG